MLASTTSMESMEKSQFNSSIEDTQSFDIYEAHNPNNVIQLKHSTFNKKTSSPEYSVPQNNYDLSYKNEGFRENSGNMTPSFNTLEELPIIHHPNGQPLDIMSPHNETQYYSSDTLPLRGINKDEGIFKNDLENENKYGHYGGQENGGQPKLSFLMELRSKMPEQPQVSTSTFGQRHVPGGFKFNLFY